jgi:hypothetical protein
MKINMENHRYLINNGLLNQHTLRNIKVNDSYDTIINLLTTVKEYREYANPNSESWIDYIFELFHLMGFNTRLHNQRIILLSEMGQSKASEILVGISLPDEDLTRIVPWLNWIDLLSLTANSMEINCGIMTNGFEIKIFDFSLDNFKEKYYWANIEKIVKHSIDESFYSLYKVLTHLKKRIDKPHVVGHKSRSKNNLSSEQKKIRKKYYDKQVGKENDFEPKNQAHISLLRIIDLYKEMTNNRTSFDQASEIIAKKYGVLSATLRQNIATLLHVNGEKFTALINNKQDFIAHLKFCFPKEIDNIDYLLK